MKEPKNILITGASRGLGAALAESYAAPGVTLIITARNQEKLSDTAKKCESKGAVVKPMAVDVTDARAMQELVREPLDLVIANAGISAGTGDQGVMSGEPIDQVRHIFSTNIEGVVNTILPAISVMEKQGHGQIAIISSIASYCGLPSAPSYSASKAAVRVYGEALRGVLKPKNIEVTVITPGYIETDMTSVNKFPMPLLMSAEKAALIINKKLKRNPAIIGFPLPMYLLMRFMATLPKSWSSYILSKMPPKPKL